jgi:hypothetical protein
VFYCDLVLHSGEQIVNYFFSPPGMMIEDQLKTDNDNFNLHLLRKNSCKAKFISVYSTNAYGELRYIAIHS